MLERERFDDRKDRLRGVHGMVPVRRHVCSRHAYLTCGGLILGLLVLSGAASQQHNLENLVPRKIAEGAQTDQQGQLIGKALNHNKGSAKASTVDTANRTDQQPSSENRKQSTFWQSFDKASTEPDWWVALGTFGLFITTSILAVFTYKLWKETRRAVGDTAVSITHTATSAKAATDAVKLSETNASTTQRAFVTLERINAVAIILHGRDGII